jgi:hypothetical protein
MCVSILDLLGYSADAVDPFGEIVENNGKRTAGLPSQAP